MAGLDEVSDKFNELEKRLAWIKAKNAEMEVQDKAEKVVAQFKETMKAANDAVGEASGDTSAMNDLVVKERVN